MFGRQRSRIVPREAEDIPSLSLLYKLRKLSPVSPDNTPVSATYYHRPGSDTGSSSSISTATIPEPSKSLNDRVGLIRGDITTLQLDAIVNAANRSLLGGGGVDGAIHRAAGPELYDECRALGGCPTGSAKITGGYGLPARKVIHAVGPIYDPLDHDKSEQLLTGCYTRSLELAVEHGCRTIAFSAISTGVYGYPSQDAAPAALGAIRRFLEGPDGDKLDKVVIVTFEMKDVEAYNEFIPLYFPPVIEDEVTTDNEDDKIIREKNEAKLAAEAEAVASELPSAPTSDPSDPGHAGKKQKQGED
ncbi:hypothetical protein C7999DRAFT_30286 [Corynascus novoguineensis]|uniref:Macro domain-containing protein n=1 Tax=Corynascus novoguineensis TaxID=1126955 RepID=A0AAN7CVT5_9PEZI|nr:hypothetical protein C7999DRAFT_30286 [Corynascus novoguineensis]